MNTHLLALLYLLPRQKYFQSGRDVDTNLLIEWTNQHGCGGNEDNDPHKLNCNIVIQYMVQDYDGNQGGKCTAALLLRGLWRFCLYVCVNILRGSLEMWLSETGFFVVLYSSIPHTPTPHVECSTHFLTYPTYHTHPYILSTSHVTHAYHTYPHHTYHAHPHIHVYTHLHNTLTSHTLMHTHPPTHHTHAHTHAHTHTHTHTHTQ